MQSIQNYSELIKRIPAKKQSTKIKKTTWQRFSYDEIIESEIFGDEEEIELSRSDVFSEVDPVKKIVKVLMWGYPTGGRGSNIENILKEIDRLRKILSSVDKKDLKKNQANSLINEFKSIHGLGFSTWSKLLYFFNVSVESKKCQIYDLKIVDSLNKKQFSELETIKWKQDIEHYYLYIELMDKLAKSMNVRPDQVELFLFYFNYYYKL